LYAIMGSMKSIMDSTTTPPFVPGSRNTGRDDFVVTSSEDDICSA
jgi:hypothetical protein